MDDPASSEARPRFAEEGMGKLLKYLVWEMCLRGDMAR
tara:strand:- start:580 stop:693 length:114 start_codon:yes stop_codon:yes gene_type:complete